MEFNQFLALLLTPEGVGLALGVVMSILAEYWAEFNTLPGKQKRIVFFAASLLIPVLASIMAFLFGFGPVVSGPREFWLYVLWPALVTGVMAFTSGTMTHLRYMQS